MVLSLLKASQFRAGPADETFSRFPLQDDVLDVVLLAESTFLRLISVFIDDVTVGLESLDLRLGVHPAMTCGDSCKFDITDSLDHITSFILRKERMPLPLQQAHILVMPDNNVEVSVFGCLFEKANMPRMEPVEAACDQNPRSTALYARLKEFIS
jgi:hypothetical protein